MKLDFRRLKVKLLIPGNALSCDVRCSKFGVRRWMFICIICLSLNVERLARHSFSEGWLKVERTARHSACIPNLFRGLGGGWFPGRAGSCLPAPPQIRTSRFPASGSSMSWFHCAYRVYHSWRRQRKVLQNPVESRPWHIASPLSAVQPKPP